MQESVKEIMSQIFEIDVDAIGDTSSPEDIERWDSLKHLQLIMALEDEFGIEFPEDDIPQLVRFDAILDSLDRLTNT